MKKRFLAILGLSIMLLGACAEEKHFTNLKTVDHVKVVDTGIHSIGIGRVTYPTVTYISNKTGEEVKRRFSSSEDYGFKDYFETAELYKEEDTYVSIVMDEHNYVVSIVLSKEE